MKSRRRCSRPSPLSEHISMCKGPTGRHRPQSARCNSRPATVNTSIGNSIAPPVDVLGYVLDREEDNDGRQSNGGCKRTGEDVGILLPPVDVATFHVVVEEPRGHETRPLVTQIVRGQVERSIKHGGNVDVAHNRVGVPLGQIPEWYWEK